MYNTYHGYIQFTNKVPCGGEQWNTFRTKEDAKTQATWCPRAQNSYNTSETIFVPGTFKGQQPRGGQVVEGYCGGSCSGMSKYVTLASTANGGCSCGY